MAMYNSLLLSTNRAYLLVGVLLYAILAVYWGSHIGTYGYYNILNVLVFCSYSFVLWNSCGKSEYFYTESRLALTVFTYSLVFVGLYMLLSHYYTGNTFIFSEADARNYERTSFAIKDMSFGQAIDYIVYQRGWTFEDWGAPMTMGFVLKMIPSKLFLNFFYVLLNTIGALLLFRIGKKLMSAQYAYMSSLTHAISSYSMFFMGVFLKEEIMVFLVIVSVYFLYEYWQSKNLIYIVIGFIASFLIVFFRPAVAVFVWISYGTLLMFGSKDNVLKGFFILIALAVAVYTYTMMRQSASRFEDASEYVNSTFSETTKYVISLGGLIGPFPALLQMHELITYKPLLGAGLLYKFLLFFAFWKGFIHCIKSHCVYMYPVFAFVILEIIGLYFVLDTLELRKSMPHIPFFILAAFWFMDRYDEDADEEVQQTLYYVWTRREFYVCIFLVFAMTLVWNTLK